MKAEILRSPPISGTIPEVRFQAVGDCTWVWFEDGAGDEWAGIFGRGPATTDRVALMNGGPLAFVVAGGRGALVDIERRTLRYWAAAEHLTDVIAVPGRDFVVACDWWQMWAFGSKAPEPLWVQAVAGDGIKLDRATSTDLRACVWEYDGWYAFRLEFDGWRTTVGELLSPHWDPVPAAP